MRALVVTLGLCMVPITASAEDPWKVGVSDKQRALAQQFLADGNALFVDQKFPEALKEYQAAVAAWNHPAIRFNIVRCLIQLERPVEAFDAVEQALEYGAAPLGEALHQEALGYRKLLANQIGNLEVSCVQPGTRVSLDGQVLIAACPGTVSQRVKPGTHQIVGVKDGYLTQTVDVKVVGGDHEKLEVRLVALESAARITRRWAVWKPWLVFGGGLAVLGAGAGLQFIASSNLDAYDRQITRECARLACDPSIDPAVAQLVEDRDRALAENRIAVGMLAVGAAAVVTGGALLYLNRTYTVYEKSRLELAPSRGGATVGLGGTF